MGGSRLFGYFNYNIIITIIIIIIIIIIIDKAFFDPKILPTYKIEDGCFLYLLYIAEVIVTSMTNFLVKPLALLISRRISGMKAGDTLSDHKVSGGIFGEDLVNYKPHGYWGWGKIMMVYTIIITI